LNSFQIPKTLNSKPLTLPLFSSPSAFQPSRPPQPAQLSAAAQQAAGRCDRRSRPARLAFRPSRPASATAAPRPAPVPLTGGARPSSPPPSRPRPGLRRRRPSPTGARIPVCGPHAKGPPRAIYSAPPPLDALPETPRALAAALRRHRNPSAAAFGSPPPPPLRRLEAVRELCLEVSSAPASQVVEIEPVGTGRPRRSSWAAPPRRPAASPQLRHDRRPVLLRVLTRRA
jgi:hypothetical protein